MSKRGGIRKHGNSLKRKEQDGNSKMGILVQLEIKYEERIKI